MTRRLACGRVLCPQQLSSNAHIIFWRRPASFHFLDDAHDDTTVFIHAGISLSGPLHMIAFVMEDSLEAQNQLWLEAPCRHVWRANLNAARQDRQEDVGQYLGKRQQPLDGIGHSLLTLLQAPR